MTCDRDAHRCRDPIQMIARKVRPLSTSSWTLSRGIRASRGQMTLLLLLALECIPNRNRDYYHSRPTGLLLDLIIEALAPVPTIQLDIKRENGWSWKYICN